MHCSAPGFASQHTVRSSGSPEGVREFCNVTYTPTKHFHPCCSVSQQEKVFDRHSRSLNTGC